MKPLIGVFPVIDVAGDVALNSLYLKAISDAGGVPLIIPFLEDKGDIARFIDICDGFCFTGGVDVDPRYYGEERIGECVEISPMRDEMELASVMPVLASGKPVLAICRGAQVINVALGGTLWQDIPTAPGESFRHRQTEERLEYSHEVNIEKGTPLYDLVGKERARANSFHHQAVKTLGEGLSVMARADDGIIEGIYSERWGYLMAYQWHPERLAMRDPDAALIFKDFIEKTKEFKTKGRY